MSEIEIVLEKVSMFFLLAPLSMGAWTFWVLVCWLVIKKAWQTVMRKEWRK